jgi:hypothetical protein
MPLFRKKPVVVEAVQLTLTTANEVEEFVGARLRRNDDGETVIATPDGPMRVKFGQYIIKGASGAFYHLDAEAFELNYERAASHERVTNE